MGVLRVLLACVVMFGHFGNHGFYMIGGDLAVQMFYVISGFSMSIIFNEGARYGNIKSFYISRALKLYPIYFVIASASLAIYAFHYFILERDNAVSLAFEQIPKEFVGISILLNILLVFQDLTPFVFFSNGEPGIVGVHGGHRDLLLIDTMMLGQSWTVALEIYFYALCPFVIRNTKFIIGLIVVSLVVLGALASLGLATVDPWSYRFFPSQLYLFLAGVLSHKIIYPIYICVANDRVARSRVIYVVVLAFIMFNDIFPSEYKKNINLAFVNGSLLFLPAFYHITKGCKIDFVLGRLSYPIYLSHFIVYFVMVRVFGRAGIQDELIIAMTTVIFSFAVSFVLDLYFIRVFDKVRYRLSGVRPPVLNVQATGVN